MDSFGPRLRRQPHPADPRRVCRRVRRGAALGAAPGAARGLGAAGGGGGLLVAPRAPGRGGGGGGGGGGQPAAAGPGLGVDVSLVFLVDVFFLGGALGICVACNSCKRIVVAFVGRRVHGGRGFEWRMSCQAEAFALCAAVGDSVLEGAFWSLWDVLLRR